jgi:Rgg/GadR/MutR family transcriptional activator
LKEYLISVDDWGRYELWIFSNTIQLFNDATLSLLMGGILQKTVFYQNIMVNRQLVIRIMLNLVALWIQRENFPLAQRYIRYLDKENLSTDFLYERLMLRYNKGFYRYKNGDKTGLVLMRECNEILGKLGCFEQENNLDKVIDDLD